MLGDESSPQGKIAPYNVSQSLRGKNLAVFEIVNVYYEAVCSVLGKEATLLSSNGSQLRSSRICHKPGKDWSAQSQKTSA